ncbi:MULTISPECIES: ABC transporter ATP-binding protein [unclassified Wenzhouxiangella]|uniref:ABC transporter ATP-binding protein n=1 Tax=unclassified Wenzhouxiangella TaxID=2613841 RepID=UPI000E325923|nr:MULTISPECIES: ABC transporter ATP-binding protein [unclassified Wenzhouxiangella]RFF26527.1 ABC transporter ATP-binding protein [Wenzhouxiangella sp. 15181]RFP67516.1 ABC transporter ATP-binding protein [Wenzhouxiangella sp. 15190]
MTRPLLSLANASKRYPPTVNSGERFRAFWQLLWRGKAEGGTAVLEDISFDIMPGESLAIIGSNGAGKSTLLKIITGVLAPTTGTIEQNGSVAALLELGAGFDPEYTGLDNLRMNAAFLGLSRREVDERLDDILAFADIGDSVYEPVKHYSSGMVVRLGFAVVASVRPDLLITDEVLAVGDESFQKKCIRWIEGYLADGGTMLMVSHSMYQVQKLCRHALWLDEGKVSMYGDVFDVTQSYLAWHERKDARDVGARAGSNPDAPYRIRSMTLGENEGNSLMLAVGDPLEVRLELAAPDGRSPEALFGIVRADGTPVYGVATDHDEIEPYPVGDNGWVVILRFPELPLLPGGYTLRAHAMDPEGLRVCDTIEQSFTVTGRSRELGLVRLKHEWRKP